MNKSKNTVYERGERGRSSPRLVLGDGPRLTGLLACTPPWGREVLHWPPWVLVHLAVTAALRATGLRYGDKQSCE